MGKIQVGFLVSYDYDLLRNAIPLVYDFADSIFQRQILIEKHGTVNLLILKNNFFGWIKEIDIKDKIIIYEDNFYQPNLTTMQCEVRERKLLANKMGIGNWIVQLDADEYFINFARFTRFLKSKINI